MDCDTCCKKFCEVIGHILLIPFIPFLILRCALTDSCEYCEWWGNTCSCIFKSCVLPPLNFLYKSIKKAFELFFESLICC